MEIWIDTTHLDLVAHAHRLGILQGVTTNTTLLASSKICPQELIGRLLEVQSGLVAVQVFSESAEAICNEARALFSISNKILIKVPVTQNGLRAIYTLNQEGIPTLATAIFGLQQALLAFKVGTGYLAPYLGRIADTGRNPIEVISQMHSMKLHYGFQGKIMGAGIRDLTTALACVKMGLCAMTLPEKIFTEFTQECESTLLALEKFSQDWSQSNFSIKF